MAATALCPELVAPVANMLAAAWAAGGDGAPAQPAPVTAAGTSPSSEPRQQSRGVSEDEGREQGFGSAPLTHGGDLRAPVDVGAGPRPRRVHRTAVRPGRGGRATGVGCRCDRG